VVPTSPPAIVITATPQTIIIVPPPIIITATPLPGSGVVIATPLPPRPTTYVVQPGDNLYRISIRTGVTMAALARANNITNFNLVFTGQTLIIPQ
jgi:LysM repeat protein